MTHFACIIGNVGGEAERCCHEVRFETRRCVKMPLRPARRAPLGELQRYPRLLARFGEGNGEREWKGLGGKGTESEGNEREGKGEMEIGGRRLRQRL